MAPAVGFEPTTKWLTATYSTAELCRSVVSSIIAWYVINILHFRENANAFPHFFVFFSKSALWMRRQKADVSILYAVFKGDKSENNSTSEKMKREKQKLPRRRDELFQASVQPFNGTSSVSCFCLNSPVDSVCRRIRGRRSTREHRISRFCPPHFRLRPFSFSGNQSQKLFLHSIQPRRTAGKTREMRETTKKIIFSLQSGLHLPTMATILYRNPKNKRTKSWICLKEKTLQLSPLKFSSSAKETSSVRSSTG